MTLTETAYWTKRLGLIFVVILSVLTVAVIVILNLEGVTTTPTFEKANCACSETRDEFVLHKIEIPSLPLASGSEQIFELETETGKVNNLPRIVNVYKYHNPGETLDSRGEANIIAEHLGFDINTGERVGTSEYKWTDTETARVLSVKARNLLFTLTTDFANPNAFPDNATDLPSDNEAKQIATQFLTSAGLMSKDYMQKQPYVTYINVAADGILSQAVSKANAELLRVDFFRETNILSFLSSDVDSSAMLDKMKSNAFELTESDVQVNGHNETLYKFDTQITTINPTKSYISVYIGPADRRKKKLDQNSVYAVDYTNWYVEPEPCGTYEVIPAHTAVDLVQNGGGSLVYLNEKNGDDVIAYQPRVVKKFTIYNVTLGYYDSPEEATFLQPVYIISGEATFDTGILGNFYYYVPAINYEAVTDKVEDMVSPENME